MQHKIRQAFRIGIVAAIAAVGLSAYGGTVQVPLKDGWRFVKADDPAAGTNLTLGAMSDILDRANRGDTSGAPVFGWAQPGFDDSIWREVRVPHDWGVEKPFDPDRAYGDAFLDQAGFRKDLFWLYQSRWRPDLPMAHILPHWNWKGREGEERPQTRGKQIA